MAAEGLVPTGAGGGACGAGGRAAATGPALGRARVPSSSRLGSTGTRAGAGRGERNSPNNFSSFIGNLLGNREGHRASEDSREAGRGRPARLRPSGVALVAPSHTGTSPGVTPGGENF